MLSALTSLPSLRSPAYRRLLDEVMRREDLSGSDKAVVLIARALSRAQLPPRVFLGRQVFYQLDRPPAISRGLRDLIVRPGAPGDLAALAAIEDTPAALLRARFDRGDLVFVGQLGDRLLCHTWFHGGPAPFPEDAGEWALWRLGPDDFWSYAAAATPEARSSGVFVKVFQTALCALFREHGAARVVCMVRRVNRTSVLLHERLGFVRQGVLTTLALPGVKVLRYVDPARTHLWIARREGGLALPVPPLPPGQPEQPGRPGAGR